MKPRQSGQCSKEKSDLDLGWGPYKKCSGARGGDRKKGFCLFKTRSFALPDLELNREFPKVAIT